MIDPANPRPPPREGLEPGPQFRPDPNREPTTPRVPRLPAADVARRIRNFTFARGYHPPEDIHRNIRLLPRRTESPESLPQPPNSTVSFFIPRSHIYRQRKIRAVAGQGDEANARAERAQMLSQIEIDLQQASRLAQKEKTAAHTRMMLNSQVRHAFGHVTMGVGLITRPEPAPEIAPSASSGPAVRMSTFEQLTQAKAKEATTLARRRYSNKQARRTPSPERVPQVETKRKANHFRARVKKDAQDATARLINSRRDRLQELEQDRREITRARVQARRKGGEGAMAQARPPP